MGRFDLGIDKDDAETTLVRDKQSINVVAMSETNLISGLHFRFIIHELSFVWMSSTTCCT